MDIVGTSLWNDVMPLIRYRTGRRIPRLAIVIDEATCDFVRLYQVRQRAFMLAAHERRRGRLFDIALQEVSDIPLAANGRRKLGGNALTD